MRAFYWRDIGTIDAVVAIAVSHEQSAKIEF